MNICKYKKQNCKLLMIWLNVNTESNFCKDFCGESSKAQLRMLKRLGVEFDSDYDGSDLLEWVKVHGKRKGDDERKAEQAKRNAAMEAERRQLLAEMPSGFELAANLYRHLKEIHKHYKETGRIKCNEAEIQRRITICKACPSKRSLTDDSGSLRCADCGCHIDKGIPLLGGKAEYEAIMCARGHWAIVK